MTAASVPAPRDGWRGPLLSILALTLIPLTPLRVLAPIEQSIILLVPAIAACAVASWWKGGRVGLAMIWVVLSVWTLSRPLTGSLTQFEDMARGFSLILAACFALVCCFGETRAFLGRGLIAVGLAIALGVGVVLGSRAPDPQETVQAELAARADQTIAAFREGMTRSPRMSAFAVRDASPAVVIAQFEQTLHTLSRWTVVVFPALLALESLIVLAVAWALFHRLSRVRIGAPLAPLREFRFNDELVWGVLLGATLLLLPTLDAFRTAGSNLLLFFGGLYAVRGLGVLAWMLAPGKLLLSLLVVLLILFPPLGTLAFGLGLGDTWLDWRNRARPTP